MAGRGGRGWFLKASLTRVVCAQGLRKTWLREACLAYVCISVCRMLREGLKSQEKSEGTFTDPKF